MVIHPVSSGIEVILPIKQSVREGKSAALAQTAVNQLEHGFHLLQRSHIKKGSFGASRWQVV